MCGSVGIFDHTQDVGAGSIVEMFVMDVELLAMGTWTWEDLGIYDQF